MIESARNAQREWQARPIAERLKVIRDFRHLIASEPTALAVWCGRPEMVESLTAEVLPILDACRFLEKTAADTLKPKRVSAQGRSSWLRGVGVQLRRDPFGVVLIVAPSNYSMMLPGIQALQALVAGNAVVWKPAFGCAEAADAFRKMLVGVGLNGRLLTVLPEDVEAVRDAVVAGVDKVVLTGSADTGRAVQNLLADELIPATMELSGSDAMFVTASADLTLAAKCLLFGLTMNDSRTCIAPRRIFVQETVATEFEAVLRECPKPERYSLLTPELIPPSPSGKCPVVDAIEAAIAQGARILLTGGMDERQGSSTSDGSLHALFPLAPIVLAGVTPSMEIAQRDIFHPVASVMVYTTIDEAIAMNDQCRYALGATIFGSGESVEELVNRVNAGCIVVNDMIVPTADPRVPFGGRKQSGFGVTRGTAGLEEMTQLKAIVRQSSSWLPHLDEPTPRDEDVIVNLIQTLHSPTWLGRLKSTLALGKAALRQRKWRKYQGRAKAKSAEEQT